MKKPAIPLGLVFSQSGPYAMMAGEMRKSALMAIDEINGSEEFDFAFAPRLRDPGGIVACYHPACDDLICEEQVDPIVGFGTPPDMRGSRAATTSSMSGRRPTSTSCRW